MSGTLKSYDSPDNNGSYSPISVFKDLLRITKGFLKMTRCTFASSNNNKPTNNKILKIKAMKTILNILTVSIISLLSLTVNAGNNNSTTPANLLPITYRVTVHISPDFPSFTGGVFVAILDENGKPVAPKQMISRGRLVLTFTEKGTVRGTRTAVLYSEPINGFIVKATPDQINGIFDAGDIYSFNLYPVLVKYPKGITP
jgi:hypothetical protein